MAISGTSALLICLASHGGHFDPDFETSAELTPSRVSLRTWARLLISACSVHRALLDEELDWDKVVKINEMIKRHEDFAEFNRVHAALLGGLAVASTTIV